MIMSIPIFRTVCSAKKQNDRPRGVSVHEEVRGIPYHKHLSIYLLCTLPSEILSGDQTLGNRRIARMLTAVDSLQHAPSLLSYICTTLNVSSCRQHSLLNLTGTSSSFVCRSSLLSKTLTHRACDRQTPYWALLS